jgi:SNF2 family DNA or RNA helicase
MDYSRLDGRTPVPDRQKIIDDFNDDASVPICLMSTRAGVGINLLGADTVIFHDVDINPQNDHQAESRCYRLGQTRTVTVYKMFTDDTVDAAIADIAIRSDTSLQIRRSDVDVDDMQLDGGGSAGEEQVAWKNVVSEALDGLGLFGEE